MRVPTYANYMNLAAAVSQNKNMVDKYTFQSVSGLKYQNYSGYGMKAYNIVSMESTLKLTNTFKENNELANIELKTSNLAIETITKSLEDVKAAILDLNNMDLSHISPDYTGKELKFTSDDPTVYLGKTLTVNGKTYTFTNTDGDGNFNIGGLSSAEDIMNVVAQTVNNVDFVYQDGKLSFPLYTIDGISTVLTDEPAKSAVETGKIYTMNGDQSLALENVQKLAFSTMQMIADALNINVHGKYIYGGGSATAPVSFDYGSLSEFQSYYDGINTVYPSSSSAALSNFAVDASNTGDIDFMLKPGSTNEGVIKATGVGGSFLKQAMPMNAANTGELKFDKDTNTMKASEYGAFNTMKAGDTIVINGGNANLGGNAKAYVVKSVSADGRTVTFDESTPVSATTAAFIPNGDVFINSTFAVGSVINLNGFNNKNLTPTATVTGISDDGTELYVKVDGNRFPTMSSAGNGKWSISSESYYQGGDLEYNQRVSESQTISFDIKANDPAFEKIFRALGQIAQGNLVDTSNPAETGYIDTMKTQTLIKEALALVNSAISGAGDVLQSKNSNLYSITAKVNADYVVLNRVMDNQTQAVVNLENNISSIKNTDKNEAAVKLLMAQSTLEASYSVLSSVSKLSLLNYMK